MKVDIKIEPRKPPIVILEAESSVEEESLQLLAGFKDLKLRLRLLIEDTDITCRDDRNGGNRNAR